MPIALHTPPRQDQIAEAIQRAMRRDTARVQRVETPAGGVWLKRTERLSLRWRLQKGDPRRRFRKDLEGLHLLHDAGLPVAPIVAEGADFYATPHLGPTLEALLRGSVLAPDDRAAIFAGAGRSLGQLHHAGYSHGRPALRDMCWTGDDVVFIDMEQFSPGHRSPRYRALDVVIFIHSALAEGATEADLDLALSAYRDEAGGADLRRARTMSRWLRWLGPVSDRALARKPGKRDLMAVRPALRYLDGLG
jgi:tRNA A-37 threonylcarbamoyl transferase component Bud32